MRFQIALPMVALALGVTLTSGCGGRPTVNFGDGTTGNLLYGVFHNWAAGDVDKALVYADRAQEVYSAEARELQASLSDYPPTDPPEAVYKYRILNDVAVAAWAKGEMLLKKGDKAGAVAAFTTVVNDYNYAQAKVVKSVTSEFPEGERGEWWKPAEKARQRLAELQPDAN